MCNKRTAKNNAIILAAGMGSRLGPITRHIPKPLVRVNGVPIIERQILFLKERGISEIHIVAGYLFQEFSYLQTKYGVNLIVNPYYREYNNIYSMFLAREHFCNTYVLESDVYLNSNFLEAGLAHSTYYTGFKEDSRNEWVIDHVNGKLVSILLPGDSRRGKRHNNGSYIMSGVSFWAGPEALIIKTEIMDMVDKILHGKSERLKSSFWDEAVLRRLEDMDIRVHKIDSTDWYEIDDEEDLLHTIEKISLGNLYQDE